MSENQQTEIALLRQSIESLTSAIERTERDLRERTRRLEDEHGKRLDKVDANFRWGALLIAGAVFNQVMQAIGVA